MKMQTVWIASKTAVFKDIPDFTRMHESAHWRIITCEAEIDVSELKQRFTHIKRSGFKCRSIKLYLPGQVPDLSDKGFIRDGKCFVFPHDQIAVAAIPYGKEEWCFMVEKRSGHGVPMHALDLIPLLEQSHQQTFWKERNTS